MTAETVFNDLKGASVFITGGGSGIGAALTEGFAAQEAKVAFVQRSDGMAFCDAIAKRTGNRPLFIQCDISDIDALKAAIGEATSQHGPISCLVNNAANDQRHTTEEVNPEFWQKSIDVNLRSYFFGCQSVVAGMRSLGHGTIINVSSISYMMGNSEYPTYVTSNAGITGMTRSMAREFGPDNIRVNAIAPGWVLTEKQLSSWATPEALEAHRARQCLKEHLAPQDIVGPVLFLASNASRVVTGQVLPVDGGVVVTG